MRGFLLTVVTVSALTLFGARAAAAGDTPPETGLGAGQLLIGTATASLALVVPLFSDGTPFETISFATLFVGPAAVGGMVCTLGQTSKHYVGGCKPVVAGAYIGALVSLPVLLLGMSSDGGGFGSDYGSSGSIAFMFTYALGSAMGATIAWHRYKQERDLWSLAGPLPAPSGSADQHWPELRWRPVPGARGATGAIVPLLAFTF